MCLCRIFLFLSSHNIVLRSGLGKENKKETWFGLFQTRMEMVWCPSKISSSFTLTLDLQLRKWSLVWLQIVITSHLQTIFYIWSKGLCSVSTNTAGNCSEAFYKIPGFWEPTVPMSCQKYQALFPLTWLEIVCTSRYKPTTYPGFSFQYTRHLIKKNSTITNVETAVSNAWSLAWLQIVRTFRQNKIFGPFGTKTAKKVIPYLTTCIQFLAANCFDVLSKTLGYQKCSAFFPH